MRIDTSNPQFQKFSSIIFRVINYALERVEEDVAHKPTNQLDERQFYPFTITLYKALYNDKFGHMGNLFDETSNAVQKLEAVLEKIATSGNKFKDLDSIVPLMRVYFNPNYSHELIRLVDHFLKVNGINNVIKKLANEATHKAKNQVSGIGGELYHASELEKLGYRIVSFGFILNDPNNGSKNQLLEVDLIVEKDGVYSFVEIKHIAGRKGFNNIYAPPADYVSKYFLEEEDGTSKKLDKFRKFFSVMRANDHEKKERLIKTLQSQFPGDNDDLQNLIKQLESSDTPFPLIFSYPYTAGVSLTYDSSEIILRDGSRITVCDDFDKLPEEAIRTIAEDIDTIDKTLLEHSDNIIQIRTNKVPFKLMNRSLKVLDCFTVQEKWTSPGRGDIYPLALLYKYLIINFPEVKPLIDDCISGQKERALTASPGDFVRMIGRDFVTHEPFEQILSKPIQLEKQDLEARKQQILKKIEITKKLEILLNIGTIAKITPIPSHIDTKNVARHVASVLCTGTKDPVGKFSQEITDIVDSIVNAISLGRINIVTGELDSVNESIIFQRITYLMWAALSGTTQQEEYMWTMEAGL